MLAVMENFGLVQSPKTNASWRFISFLLSPSHKHKAPLLTLTRPPLNPNIVRDDVYGTSCYLSKINLLFILDQCKHKMYASHFHA